MKSPETSFAARSGDNKLSFIDHCYDKAETGISRRRLSTQAYRTPAVHPRRRAVRYRRGPKRGHQRDGVCVQPGTGPALERGHQRDGVCVQPGTGPALLRARCSSATLTCSSPSADGPVLSRPPCDQPICRKICQMAVDMPSESGAGYYKRMDALHWSD